MADISVIIVSWNARGYLRDCLISTREAADVVREVIVIDNGSSDGSPEMVAEHFPEVTLIRSAENMGFARANNLGIARASGSCLGFINSDVRIHSGCLSQLAEFLRTHSRVGLVGPKIVGTDGRLQRTCRLAPTVWNIICETFGLDRLFSRWPLFSGREMRHWDQNSTAEVEVLSGCFWMARREAVQKVGGLDEQFFFYAEDIDWCKRFHDASWDVCFVPAATATHFGGASSSQAPLRYSIEMLRANLLYWKKHHGIMGRFLYLAASIVGCTIRLLPLAALKLTRSANSQWAKSKFEEYLFCLRWLLTGREI